MVDVEAPSVNGKIALIFGVAGQDGTHMADLLLDQGYRVIGTSRDPAASQRRFPNYRWNAVELVSVDMRSTNAIGRLIDRVAPDEIYNFAAFSTGAGMYDDPVSIVEINALAVARILEVVRSRPGKIRFCQASSSEMFGIANSSPQSEQTPFRPRSPYGAAKLLAHNLVGIARQRDMAFACSAILYNHESARRPTTFVTRKITRGAAAIFTGIAGELVLGDLDARRDWGHATDVVRAMWLMLQADKPDDYVIATGTTHSVADLCGIAFGHVGLDWRQYVRVDPALRRAPDGAQLVGDPRRAAERLGWKPKIIFEDMIKEMVDTDLRDLQARSDIKGKSRDRSH